MRKLQEVFDRIQETKKEQRELKAMYRDALANSSEYQHVKEKLEKTRERKKQIEENIKDEFDSEFRKLDRLKIDIQTDNEMLSDIALNQYMKGETVKIVDKYENKYEPLFSVKFKKV